MAKQKSSGKKSNRMTLPVMRPNAAGLDVGSNECFVCVPEGRDSQTIRSFETFTQDLHGLAHWLKECGVDTVAMESTGVYWIPIFQILDDAGIEVCLVNAHHVKTAPGRKSDVSDCQWLQYLHSVGLLQASYRPAQEVCSIRSLLRHRAGLVQQASSHVLRMQKSLTQMNLRLHNVISSIVGESGLAIIDGILAGERDPFTLAKLCNYRIRATSEDVAASLIGDYRPEHLFTLRQSLQCYRLTQQLIQECDQEIRKLLNNFESKNPSQPEEIPVAKNEDDWLELELKRLFGVNLVKIPGLGLETVQMIFGEVGPNFTKFRSASAFASWLTVCPNNKVSGGKVLSSKTRRTACRAALALRIAASNLRNSKSALGNFYRRMCARLGKCKAVTAAAHKLARVIFHLVTTGQEFDESRFTAAQGNYQKHQESKLRARAKALGFQLLPLAKTT
jgi:transposase